MRRLVLMLGLLLGAVGALLAKGSVGHLALVPGVALPDWAGTAAPESWIWAGSTDLGNAQLSWDFAPERLTELRLLEPRLPEPRWAVAVNAVGASSRLLLVPQRQGVSAEIAAVDVDIAEALANLSPGGNRLGLDGEIVVRAPGQGWLTWSGELQEAQLAMRALALSWSGNTLGAIDIDLEVTRPVWRGTLRSTPGSALDLSGTLQGLSGGQFLTLDVVITDTPGLPDELRGALNLGAEASTNSNSEGAGQGWRLGRNIALPFQLP